MKAKAPNFSIENSGDNATIYLYDRIGLDFFGDGISIKSFADELGKIRNARHIDLRINSGGGSVFDGNTMYTLLKDHKAKINVFIDGIAASIATVVAMAGDTIEIAPNGLMMIHEPTNWVPDFQGDSKAYRQRALDDVKQADLLETVRKNIVDTYVARTGADPEELMSLMANETWFNAQQALERKFVDRIGNQYAVAACVDLDGFKYRNVPKDLVATVTAEQKPTPESILQRNAERQAKPQYRKQESAV